MSYYPQYCAVMAHIGIILFGNNYKQTSNHARENKPH